MSELRDYANNALSTEKKANSWMFQAAGWFMILIGVICTVTVFLAPIGIPIIICGILALVFLPKWAARKMESLRPVLSEVAEVHEHKLRGARQEEDK